MKNKINIVLNEGNGKVINNLFNCWNNVKTEKQYTLFTDKLKATKFGTYGTIPFFLVFEKFNPKFPNEVLKISFYSEAKRILTN